MHFQIAVRYFLNFKNARSAFVNSKKLIELQKQDWQKFTKDNIEPKNLNGTISEVLKQIFEIRTFAIITMTNTVMCLEGLINLYGAFSSSNSYFKSHLEKLDIVSKWVVLPNLFAGSHIDKGSEMFANFKALIKSRNEMIHPKSSVIELEKTAKLPTPTSFIKQTTELDKQFQSMLLLIIDLKRIDPAFKPVEIYNFLWDDEVDMPGFSEMESFKASLFTQIKKSSR